MEFAKTLKTVMRQQAISTAELAKEINVSPKTIADWLTGRTPRDLDAVKRCAEHLGVENSEYISLDKAAIKFSIMI